MNDTERQVRFNQQTAELYQAVGEFAVKFEHVTHAMQQGIISLLQIAGLQNYQLGEILLADLTASPLKSIFQAMLIELVTLSPTDRRICESIFKRAQTLIETRNNVIHSTWYIGWAGSDDTDVSETMGTKLGRGKKGAQSKTFSYQAKTFRGHASECEVLAVLLFRLRVCASGGRSISKNFVIDKEGFVSEPNGSQETP